MSDRAVARQKRLSEALRENLKRRKSQSRRRAVAPKPDEDADPHAAETPEDDA